MNLPLRLFAATGKRHDRTLSRVLLILNAASKLQRSFAASSSHNKNPPPLPPRTPLPANTITISYLKGSGPGGQKINKTNSAVQIKHLPSGLVIKCQDTRSRDQNEKLAMRRLQDKLEVMEKEGTGEISRVERRRELLRRRKLSKAKKAKRKYRVLEEGKEDEEVGEEDVVGESSETKRREDGLAEDETIVARDERDLSPEPQVHETQPSSKPG